MSIKSTWASQLSLLLALPVAGCYSLTQLRVQQVIRAADQRVVLGVWFMARGWPVTGGDAPVGEAVMAVLLYPLDVVFSTAVAVRAPFDSDLDITWGPVGAVAGITLPWVTLIPHLYPPHCLIGPSDEVRLSSSDFAALVSRIRSGDGLYAYRELVDPASWACGREAMMSVVLVDGPDTVAAQRDAAAGEPRGSNRETRPLGRGPRLSVRAVRRAD